MRTIRQFLFCFALIVSAGFATTMPADAQGRSYYTGLLSSQYRNLSSEDRINVQQLLYYAGFYNSSIDGMWGPNTQQALVDGIYALEMQFSRQFDMNSAKDIQEIFNFFSDGRFALYIVGEGEECDGCQDSPLEDQVSSVLCSDYGVDVFSCGISGSAKQVAICINASGIMRYRFGADLNSPELELYADAVGGFDGFYNYGGGQSIWHEATFTNGGYSYLSGFSVDRMNAEHPIVGYVMVKQGDNIVADLRCTEPSIQNNFDVVYEYTR
jgi:hypothetical protein